MRVPTSRRHRRTTQRAAVQRRLHDERTRISQDLHDHVGAQLSAVLSGIDLARLSACGSVFPDSTAATLDRIEAHARAAMAHLRETVWALHHKTVPLPAFRDRLRRYAHGQVALRTDA
ncbi:MAG: histidine kinase, partial [Bacteroidota bacterium]